MRRKDREVSDFEDIMDIINHCDVCRVVVNDGEFPYIIPMNFGTEVVDNQLYLYFHSAKEGKKIDLFKKNNKVTFEMDCEHNIILYEERMTCTMGYASVIGHGIIEEVEEEKKYEALKILMKHYHSEDFEFNTSPIPRTAVFKLTVLEMTAKRRNNVHTEEKHKEHISLE